MSKFYCQLLLLTVLMLHVSRACEGRNHEEEDKFAAASRQQTENYFAYAYGYTPNVWNSLFYRPNLRYVPAGK